jgi:hypothetical protein
MLALSLETHHKQVFQTRPLSFIRIHLTQYIACFGLTMLVLSETISVISVGKAGGNSPIHFRPVLKPILPKR